MLQYNIAKKKKFKGPSTSQKVKIMICCRKNRTGFSYSFQQIPRATLLHYFQSFTSFQLITTRKEIYRSCLAASPTTTTS